MPVPPFHGATAFLGIFHRRFKGGVSAGKEGDRKFRRPFS
jgi:hypothetical protein